MIQAGLSRRYTWVTSPALIEEIERVMNYKKFGLTQNEVQILTQPIFRIAEIVIPIETINAIPRCPGDNRVLECAIKGNCDFITTGDRRDLLSLKQFRGVKVITARQFLDSL